MWRPFTDHDVTWKSPRNNCCTAIADGIWQNLCAVPSIFIRAQEIAIDSQKT